MRQYRIPSFILIALIVFLSSCTPTTEQPAGPEDTNTPRIMTETPTATITEIPEKSPEPSPTVTITRFKKTSRKMTTPQIQTPEPAEEEYFQIEPEAWASWPIIPSLSPKARKIYDAGIKAGNDPHRFSTIGDCQGMPEIFMGIFETDRNPLALPKDAPLIETVAYFEGSFNRQSHAVSNGLSAPSALSPLWANPEFCEPNENPIQCELRIHRPAYAFIILGTNWSSDSYSQKYYDYMQQIVDILIDNGTLPILTTKADNIEGDHSINLITAQIAYENELPLWNFWLAADTLPNHGLDADQKNIYLTPAGWNRLSYTGLQVLDSLRRELESK